jgi:hypothetical protein
MYKAANPQGEEQSQLNGQEIMGGDSDIDEHNSTAELILTRFRAAQASVWTNQNAAQKREQDRTTKNTAKLEMKTAYQQRANKEPISPPPAATIASLLSITTDPFLHSSSSSSFAFANC